MGAVKIRASHDPVTHVVSRYGDLGDSNPSRSVSHPGRPGVSARPEPAACLHLSRAPSHLPNPPVRYPACLGDGPASRDPPSSPLFELPVPLGHEATPPTRFPNSSEPRRHPEATTPSAAVALDGQRRSRWLGRPVLGGLAILLVATLLAYLPGVWSPFLPFDDQDYIYLNPPVASGLQWDSIVWAFTKIHHSNWHPLTWISHMLDVQWFGMDPRGHHVTSILIHTLNAGLLYAVLTYLTGQAIPSFMVAALFALHPTNIEPVLWAAQRKTLLSTTIALLSIAAYAAYVKHQSWRWYVISLLLFAASLMAKQTFVTLPLLLILLDYWPLRWNPDLPSGPIRWMQSTVTAIVRRLPDKLPFVLLAGLASVVTLVSQTDAMRPLEYYSITLRLGNVSLAYVRYLLGLIWPRNLSIYYPLHKEAVIWWAVTLAVAVLVLLTAVALRYARNRPYLLVGWLWFLVSMLPVIGWFRWVNRLADRYLYSSAWGVFGILSWLPAQWLSRPAVRDKRFQLVVAAMLVSVVGLLGWETHRRATRWQSVPSVFQEAIDNSSPNWLAHRVLAELAVENQQFEEGVFHISAALELVDSDSLYVIYSMAKRGLGDRTAAVDLLNQELAHNPDDALSYSLLAINHWELGNTPLADQYRQTAESKLELPGNRNYPRIVGLVVRNCGNVLMYADRPAEAVERFQESAHWSPLDRGLIHDWARAEIKLGRYPQAIERLRAAIAAHPDDPAAYQILATAHKQAGNRTAAVEALREALRIAPWEPQSTCQLAENLMQTGQLGAAEELLEAALAHYAVSPPPQQAERWTADVLTLLGDIHVARRDPRAATDRYRAALRSGPISIRRTTI